MVESEVDRALDFVLNRSGPSVDVFLESVFDFLSRYTDFYQVTDDPGAEGRGFKPGVAEKLVQRSFQKFKPQERVTPENKTVEKPRSIDLPDSPLASSVSANTETVQSTSTTEVQKKTESSDNLPTKGDASPPKIAAQDGDTFNGSETSKYKWAQTQEDVDMRITFSNSIVNRSQIKVNITQKDISVKLKNGEGAFEDYVCGEFHRKVDASVSTWNFDSKKHVLHIFLEKSKPASWWKRLLVNENEEKDLDLSKLDTTVHLHDLPVEEQATIDQLRYDQECKLKGLPTSKERKTQEILKKAWNAEGSPFAGKPFNPSDVQIH